ncbi:MAG TPA: zf-HC2 domain-containing protein [Chloroflexia bacterium]|nr:zf-HC2 domain-containing protein [Chloroflexia bacterium]
MNPECKRYRPLLSALLDNDISRREEVLVQQHLISCADCRDVLASYRNISQKIHSLSHPLPPTQLRTAVMARTRGEQVVVVGRKPVRGLNPLLSGTQKLAVGLTALVVVVLVGILVTGVLTTQPFEVNGPVIADATDQKIVVAFSRPVDKEYVLAHANELFTVTDEQGKPIQLDLSRITVEDNGTKVELGVQRDTTPIEPSSSLQVSVKPSVKDAKGTPLSDDKGKPLSAPVERTVQVIVPATKTPVPASATATSGSTATATAVPATTVGNPDTSPGGSPAATPTVITATPVITPTATATVQPATSTPAVTATSTPGATATSTPGITATVPVTGTVSGTGTPVPGTSTPAVTVTPGPTVTPPANACVVALRNYFGQVYNTVSGVAARIGCPTAVEAQASLTYQRFQNGYMLWYKQSGWIYVFYNNGNWTRFQDPGPAVPTPTATATTTPSPTATIAPTATLGGEVTRNPAATTSAPGATPTINSTPAPTATSISTFATTAATTSTAATTVPPGQTTTPSASLNRFAAAASTVSTTCTVVPQGSIGNVWSTFTVLQKTLGCALAAEQSSDGGAFQPFERGQMFFNPLATDGRPILVVFFDGTYMSMPDA